MLVLLVVNICTKIYRLSPTTFTSLCARPVQQKDQSVSRGGRDLLLLLRVSECVSASVLVLGRATAKLDYSAHVYKVQHAIFV